MSIFNSVWGLLALVAIFGIVFVKAGTQAGESGGDQAATIVKNMGGAGANFVSALEGGNATG